MKQRLTLEKVNAAIEDMASYAEANAQLIAAPRRKVFLTCHFVSTHLRNPSLLIHFPSFSFKW